MSIRRRLSLLLVLAVILLCGLAAATCYVRARTVLWAEYDQTLEQRAKALSAWVHREPTGELELIAPDLPMPEFSAGPNSNYLQIWDFSGKSLLRSGSLAGGNITLPASNEGVWFWDVVLPDGRPGRAVRIQYLPAVEVEGDSAATDRTAPTTLPVAATVAKPSVPMTPVTLALMQDLAPIRRIERLLLESLLVATGLLCAAVLIVVPLVVRRGLVSVRRLGDQAKEIDAATLGQRFAVDGTPSELRPVAERLNDLLARLEAAFTRERRFTGNVAHELRTPIAELRAMAEVSLKWPGDGRSAECGFREALSIARRMEKVVATLLALARSESGVVPYGAEAIELGTIVREAWHQLDPSARARSVDVDLPSAAITICSDEALVRTMVSNLLANAAEYCSPGGRVSCALVAADDRVELRISNPTDKLKASEVPLVSEPFWRADSAGTDLSHAGLGLSLVAAYSKVLGAELCFTLSEQQIFCARLVFRQVAHRPAMTSDTFRATENCSPIIQPSSSPE